MTAGSSGDGDGGRSDEEPEGSNPSERPERLVRSMRPPPAHRPTDQEAAPPASERPPAAGGERVRSMRPPPAHASARQEPVASPPSQRPASEQATPSMRPEARSEPAPSSRPAAASGSGPSPARSDRPAASGVSARPPAGASERPAAGASARPPAGPSERPASGASERAPAYKSLPPPGRVSGRPAPRSYRPPAGSPSQRPSGYPSEGGSLRAPSISEEYRNLLEASRRRSSRAPRPKHAEAPEAWDGFQLRHCLLMLLALLLEVIFPSGYIATAVGGISVAAMLFGLRQRWTPPGQLDASVHISLVRLLVVIPLPLLVPRVGWWPCGLLVALSSVLGVVVVAREHGELRRQGFAVTFDQEVSALTLAIAASTIVAGERLWQWALWLGALRYLYLVAIRTLGTADQIEVSSAGRYQHVGTGLLIGFVFFVPYHAVLAGALAMMLGLVYGRACLRAAG